jgi:hypothetical protein
MDKDAHEELLLLQEARLDDIRELKRYQWQSSYYSILALGGLIAVLKLTQTTPSLPYRLLLVVGAAGVFVSWFFINRAIQRSLERSREAREAGYLLFNEAVMATRPQTRPEVDRDQIYRVLLVVVLLGSVLTAITILAP